MIYFQGLKKPYNPILGETFRCFWLHPNGTRSHFVAEQVSHHPPVSAFYVSNREEGYVVNCSCLAKSKFYGEMFLEKYWLFEEKWIIIFLIFSYYSTSNIKMMAVMHYCCNVGMFVGLWGGSRVTVESVRSKNEDKYKFFSAAWVLVLCLCVSLRVQQPVLHSSNFFDDGFKEKFLTNGIVLHSIWMTHLTKKRLGWVESTKLTTENFILVKMTKFHCWQVANNKCPSCIADDYNEQARKLVLIFVVFLRSKTL